MPGEVTHVSSPVITGTTPKSIVKMREARASSTASSTYSSYSSKLADGCAKEFLWGCELTKEKKEYTWTFEEEEDDQDFLVHTLFLRHVVLGQTTGKDERHVVEVETKTFNGDVVKQPMAVVTKGQDMCRLDLNFSHEIPVTFRLVEGSGPVYLSAQHLVEFPSELNESEYTATETDITDDDEEEVTEEDEEEEEVSKKGTKRKGKTVGSKKKRGKMDSECSEEDDEDDDEDEEEEEDDEEESMEEDEESEEPESSPEKKTKKGKKGKVAPPAKGKKEKMVAKGKKGKKGKAK